MGKYEEALERAKQGLPMDEVFPELKESEDERIRKALLRCCDDWEKGRFGCMNAADIPAVRAYLEKQKYEYEVFEPVESTLEYKMGFKAGVESEKQKEQKPSTEETELNSIAFLEQLGYTCIPPGAEQKPAEWSEEDENKIESIKGLITTGKFVDTNTIRTIWKLLDSLYPQHHWKPSEKEIEALSWSINYLTDIEPGRASTLALLKFNLKSL